MRNKKTGVYKEEEMGRLIRQRMMEAADEYEQELESDPALQGIRPSPQVFENIMAEIRREEAAETLLSEEDRKALEIGRKQMAHRRRNKILRTAGAAAAVVLGVFSVSMASEANRVKLMDTLNVLIGREAVARLDNQEGHKQYSDEEERARAEIRDKIGVSPVVLMYQPDGMEFDGYSVDQQAGRGFLYYRYGDTVMKVTMVNKESNISYAVARDGEVTGTFSVETNFGTAEILEIEGPEETDYMAELTYDNAYYAVCGILPKEEFVKLIEKMEIF